MKTLHEFIGGDRYLFDFHYCNGEQGYAQIDTKEDASYWGNWANPKNLKVAHFVEGEFTVHLCESPEEFVQHLRDFADSCDRLGYGPMKIDPLCKDDIENGFRALGLADLLH